MFMGELALEMGIPVEELRHRMSAWELTVFWPRFFAVRRREQTRAVEEAKNQ